MTDKITTERRGNVLMIGLTRPDKRNAFDPDMIGQLAAAYTQLDEDKSLRAGVVWADGHDFTSGLDMAAIAKQIPKMILHPLIPRGMVDPWGVNSAPCRKPIVTAVQGRCFTLGIELMLCNQISVASQDATFTQYEVSRGLLPFGGGTVRWPLTVGTHNANRYLLTGEEFDAAEALRIGLVQHIVPHDERIAKAFEIADKIAQQAPLAVQAALRNSRLAQGFGTDKAIHKINFELVKLLFSKDLRRGFKAFKARETAKFEGN